jgi:hypothetical protein
LDDQRGPHLVTRLRHVEDPVVLDLKTHRHGLHVARDGVVFQDDHVPGFVDADDLSANLEAARRGLLT